MTARPSDDQAAIRDLIAAYALALDAGDVDGCVQLFAPDGEFLVYGKTFAGHDGIAGMFRDAAHGLHLTGVSHIAVDGERATARSQVLFVRVGDLELRPALYDDELTLVAGQWRFARRRCSFITRGGLADSPEDAPA
ncbi:nuclear transport factor 2 family protein [Mycobacterium sp. WUMAC-067]|uniref:nuclear transport factor 2 family protein n=1 Tax=unclassified Mycobacterium TaxID=2642494 RepID=UPI001CD9E429|nr:MULTISPECIES: nuclear transport factor 2 family protein [unclassified Mycobacterium]MCA2241355.1 nuclear transport factor 2 family protein [Mycobacterium sp. WUMAC-067]MCA2313927.1 nuclear transport factor 2 family protein [Mycobacterium sp. WUMAC-025]